MIMMIKKRKRERVVKRRSGNMGFGGFELWYSGDCRLSERR